MEMLYHIVNLCPASRAEMRMSGAGFSIQLFPHWKDAVAQYEPKLDQRSADTVIKTLGRAWLDGCGYTEMHDPDADPLEQWKHENMVGEKPKLGPNAKPLYEPRTAIRIQWGEWGPEHITVPGNACGLDIDNSIGAPRGGRVLLPHNVDTLAQAHLLLVVFTWFADTLVNDQELRAFQA